MRLTQFTLAGRQRAGEDVAKRPPSRYIALPHIVILLRGARESGENMTMAAQRHRLMLFSFSRGKLAVSLACSNSGKFVLAAVSPRHREVRVSLSLSLPSCQGARGRNVLLRNKSNRKFQ